MPESHLPDCPHAEPSTPAWPVMCICDRLRACEARVREEYAMEWQTEQEEIHLLGLNLAYRKGLDAARHEIVVWLGDEQLRSPYDLIAAIDALRPEPSFIDFNPATD